MIVWFGEKDPVHAKAVWELVKCLNGVSVQDVTDEYCRIEVLVERARMVLEDLEKYGYVRLEGVD